MIAASTTTTPAPAVPKIDVQPMLHELAHIGVTFWWLWVMLAAIPAVRVSLDLHERRRLARAGIDQVDEMDGQTFEAFLGALFRQLGYRVEITQFRGDWGADLVVAKDGRRTAVQALWDRAVLIERILAGDRAPVSDELAA